MANTNPSDEILHDFYPVARVFKDGRIEKLLPNDDVPPSLDPVTGVQSKDVEISPENNVSARLYLPKPPIHAANSPPRLHPRRRVHARSAFSALHHRHLNSLVARANVVAVSVDYRVAPEHLLPICYEDSWLALKWTASQFTIEGGEEWIKEYADSDRVFLGGDSAGGNIAQNMAVRVGSEKLEGINLRGLFLDCPFFSGKEPNAHEEAFWQYVCKTTKGFDDPRSNPAVEPNLSGLGCERVLVFVGEMDDLKDRGWYYKETLSKSGWGGEIEVVEVKGEGHGFCVLNPNSENTLNMLKKVADFLNHY
ncbi:hypothetical protein DH2020_030580 [Rehmannia glutinosa]|uniref:Alpha/beta hydrolase fold-3 domain-containing protein n=1 Tax=Rehmannia glutinosa TaxID=99300 RepID=A0ABR0VKD9_REHGL